MTTRHEALVSLGRTLRSSGYRFTTITPLSHARVVARRSEAKSLTDVFGWSLAFDRALLDGDVLDALEQADALVTDGERWRSRVRFSSLDHLLYAHAAYPTDDPDAVFFGPDTYRFAALLRRVVGHAKRVVDVGCGSGAGGLCIADVCDEVVLGDVNDEALALAHVNAELNDRANVTVVRSDVLDGVEGAIDLVVANPPYLVDERSRTYRDGGGDLGIDVAMKMARDSLARLDRGGRLVLYSGTPVVDGKDPLRESLEALAHDVQATMEYAEIDPDVFGEELEKPAYAQADRIAVISAVITRA